jgi:hypothetical protein
MRACPRGILKSTIRKAQTPFILKRERLSLEGELGEFVVVISVYLFIYSRQR